MSAAADIDWNFFGRLLRAHIAIGNRGKGVLPGEAAAAAGVSRSTFWRARQCRPLTSLTFRAICAWLGAEPERFRRDYWELQLRECGDRQQEAMTA